LFDNPEGLRVCNPIVVFRQFPPIAAMPVMVPLHGRLARQVVRPQPNFRSRIEYRMDLGVA
jgi:hypothetical protein